tara:strand:- start:42 stop:212 length:171 start_codon:yes stop_codon:yes gene_type:complete
MVYEFSLGKDWDIYLTQVLGPSPNDPVIDSSQDLIDLDNRLLESRLYLLDNSIEGF